MSLGMMNFSKTLWFSNSFADEFSKYRLELLP